MSFLEAEIRGLPELHKVLVGLADDFRGKVTREGIKRAAKVFEAYYQTVLPNGTQEAVRLDPKTNKYILRARIKTVVASKVWPFPDRTGYAGIIGTISGMAPHAHLIEHGTKFRYRTKYGIGGKFAWVMLVKKLQPGDPETKTGVMPATHPLQRAYEIGKEDATQMFITVLQAGISGRALGHAAGGTNSTRT